MSSLYQWQTAPNGAASNSSPRSSRREKRTSPISIKSRYIATRQKAERRPTRLFPFAVRRFLVTNNETFSRLTRLTFFFGVFWSSVARFCRCRWTTGRDRRELLVWSAAHLQTPVRKQIEKRRNSSNSYSYTHTLTDTFVFLMFFPITFRFLFNVSTKITKNMSLFAWVPIIRFFASGLQQTIIWQRLLLCFASSQRTNKNKGQNRRIDEKSRAILNGNGNGESYSM